MHRAHLIGTVAPTTGIAPFATPVHNILPTGQFTGTPEEALDGACGLYLNDPTAWLPSPTN